MAKPELRERALEMRKEGMSYSAIKEALGVSKGVLSVWLRDYPLSRERINELRGNSERRIERYRETRARKREERMRFTYESAAREIGTLSDRELYLSGLFLYWAEGTKASRGTVCMTNTDPSMLLFFIRWIEAQGVVRARLKVKLHLYSDMAVEAETAYWEHTLGLPRTVFMKSYIKITTFDKPKNYKGRFGHGTCTC